MPDERDRGRSTAGGARHSTGTKRPGTGTPGIGRNGFEASRNGFGVGQGGLGPDGGRAGRPGVDSAAGDEPRGRHLGEAGGRAGWTGPTGAELATAGGPADVARAAGSGPWPALPDDPVRPGHRPDKTAATTGGAATGGSGGGPTGGGWPAVTGDLWPALPDDRLLWTVPGAALDADELGRLEREQAGD